MGLIRLLLALAVFVEHSGPLFGLHLVGGELAVQAFYAISGFYMAMILQERYAGKLGLFWRNRFLRLFPVYWALLLPLLLLSGLRLLTTHGTHGAFLDPWRLFASRVELPGLILSGLAIAGLFLQDLLFFVAVDPVNGALHWSTGLDASALRLHAFLPIPASWTLSLELTFYLLAPWLCRLRIRTLTGIALGSLGLRFLLAHHGLAADPWSYRFFPTALAFFLAGTLAWKVGSRLPERPSPAVRSALWAGLLLAILVWPWRGEPSALFLVGLLAASLPSVFILTRDWSWDRRLGELSFPLYLCHWPVVALTPRLPVPAQAALSLLVAALLHATVGRMAERRRHPVP